MTNTLKTLTKKADKGALIGWLAQRVTAALMAVFTVIVLLQVIFSKGSMGYDKWAGIFASHPMKLLSLSVIFALAWHVFLGMREIYMDYIKPVGLRLTMKVLTLVWLAGCAGWAIQVLWRV